MGVLGWIVFPLLAPDFGSDPLGAGVTRVVLLTLGLIWLFVLSLLIVRREEGDLRWATVRRRLRLNTPRDPATGEPRARLWLWVVPFLVAVTVVQLLLSAPIRSAWVSVFPFLAEPAGYGPGAIFQSREVLARLEGAWWFLALFVANAVFNTILGEELLFRGVLLPKMGGVFGRWSWVANGVLFGLLPPAPALGHPDLRPHRPLVRLPRLPLPEHVDVRRPPLRPERVPRRLGARGGAGARVGSSSAMPAGHGA